MLSLLAINFGFIAMLYEKITEQLGYVAGHDWLTGAMSRGNLEKTSDIIKSNIHAGKTATSHVTNGFRSL